MDEIKRSIEIPRTDGVVVYASWWSEIEDLVEHGDNELALEMLLALGRYGFYGEEYEGSIGEVRRSVISKAPLMDRQINRYSAAAKGGKASNKVSDDQIVEAVQSGQYGSNAELGRALGISGQAVGQRLKKLGLSLREPVLPNFVDRGERLQYLTSENNEA